MTFPSKKSAYAPSTAVTSIGAPLFQTRDPTSNDVGPPYEIQQAWVNTNTQGIWILQKLTSASGSVTAQWRSVGPVVLSTSDPTSSDYQYPLGQIWINTSTNLGYLLVDVTSSSATWINFTGSGSEVNSFTVPAGTSPVVPDASGVIDIPAGNGFQFTGGTNAMTGAMTSPFTGNFTFDGTVSGTTFDTNVAAAGATLTDTTLSVDGTDSNIDLNLTPKGTGSLAVSKSASGEWIDFNDGTDSFGYYNHAGSPESNVAANIGSICSDTTNGDVYVKTTDTANTGWTILDAGGSGDVQGPASATDNALCRYDGTTGKLIQDSTVIVTDAGEMTNASQPSVIAYKSSDTSNATGDGTTVTIIGDTEVVDYNSDYDTTTGIYEAPVTGIHYATVMVTNSSAGAADDMDLELITSNRTYRESRVDGMVIAGSDTASFGLHFTTDMDASDTAYWQETVSGTTKTVSIRGNAAAGNHLTVVEFGLLN